MKQTKREKAFWVYLSAVQTALDTIPETAKENIEDKASAYFETLEAEGFEYEEGWEFAAWNKPEFRTYEEAKENGFAFPSKPGETVCVNEPQEGLAFLCNVLCGFTTKRTAAAFDSFGKALAEFVEGEESPESEAKLSEAVSENETALKRAGFAVFVPKEKGGYKEIK